MSRHLFDDSDPLPVTGSFTATVDPGTPITGETLETGGVGIDGWLSSIRKRLATALGAHGGMVVEGVASGVPIPVSGSVTADTELPAASALNGTIAKSVSAPMVGAAVMYSDGTNLIEPDSTHGLPVSQLASENHLGEVGGNCISKSVTFNRPAATTQYSAKDALNVDIPVTGATNATPIVVTAVAHGLADGDYVTISNVGGNTNANGSYYAKVTTYSADTFALYTDKALTTARGGNSSWTSGGDVARLFRLKGVFRKAGGDGYITRIRVGVDSVTALLGDNLRIHFYRAPLAVVLDNLAYPVLWANIALRCGYVNMPALITEGGGSDMAYISAVPGSVDANSVPCGLPLHVENGETPADTDLYFRIEELSTGTPAANQPIFVEVTIDNN